MEHGRYIVIIFPLEPKTFLNCRSLTVVLHCMWMYSFVLRILYTHAVYLSSSCVLDMPKAHMLAFTLLILMCLLPLLVIVWMYIHIVVVTHRQIKFMRSNSSQGDSSLLANR